MIDEMKQYPHLMEYYDHFIKTDGKAERERCFPYLILWIRAALGDNEWEITRYLEMTDETEEEFGSWGHNSRWAHVVEPMIANILLEGSDEEKEWLTDTFLQIAEEHGDPDVERIYFNQKD